MPYLIHTFHIHRIDWPAHGYSPEAASFTLPTLTRLIEHTLKGFPGLRGPFVMLGWSMGGAIALEYAPTRAAPLSHVVLLASSPKFRGEPDWMHALAPDALAILRYGMVQKYNATIRPFLSLNLGPHSAPHEADLIDSHGPDWRHASRLSSLAISSICPLTFGTVRTRSRHRCSPSRDVSTGLHGARQAPGSLHTAKACTKSSRTQPTPRTSQTEGNRKHPARAS